MFQNNTNPLAGKISQGIGNTRGIGNLNVNDIMKFMGEYGSNPQKAEQAVQSLINDGSLSQAQFEQLKGQVPMAMNMLKQMGIMK